ncbi:DUF523 domain-containing protein [Clostridiaceae bacterium UIB06]|uniref:DUF523 domain-containing protein n=1 Tax=Clostridium thailandense TaxID=2794346 RepID=A0A949TWS2_9CLOT|nr:CD3072 family TudS-related putative desulfidase [Clostridium thailandense]MBV7271859.1 DUF523 domain-containing protein [Clostridium thailandense]MCH5136872.1 DUF523 domain-containing protein [Clostridiaceae bacterium UIB06]
MFNDKRGKKVVLVAHCVLNQNAKIDQCAHYPGAIKEVAEILINNGVGIIQMPCPEMLYLGLDREVDKSTKPTVESEDSRVFERMSEDNSQALCKKIANNIVYQIKEYQKHNFEVIGLIGINGSPTCGIETAWAEGIETNENGVFIKLLKDELCKNNISINMIGIKAYNLELAVKSVKEMLDSI